MAGINFRCDSGEVSLSAATAKTVVQLTAPANQRVLVRGIDIHFRGVNPIASPAKIRVLRQTTAGTMTSLTPVKLNNADSETIQSTAQHTATAEPTAGTVLMTLEQHPQSSNVLYFPYDIPIHLSGGTRLGVEITATDSVTVSVGLTCEE